MCEDMANGPDKEHSNYVLTEDMIDAAMTQHISHQDDGSEGGSSQDGIEEVEEDHNSRDSADDVGCTFSSITDQQQENNTSIEHVNEPISYDQKGMSILVIDTGLGKSKSDFTEKDTQNEIRENNISDSSPNQNTCDKFNNEEDCTYYNEEELIESIPSNETAQCKVQNANNEIQAALPILKQILTDNHASNSGHTNGNPIDLCESDTDEMSEDEMTGIEGLIDNELKSVMESNLMAEVGITVDKQSISKPSSLNRAANCTPKITVKSMAQQSSANILTNKAKATSAVGGERSNTNNVFNSINNLPTKINDKNSSNPKFDISYGTTNQTASPIHINKIAVPHKTFVNSQGKKMKCVYVKNPTSMPLVINSQQLSSGNNIKLMVNTSQITPQIQKGPAQLTPIAALTNMTSKPRQFQKLLPKPANNFHPTPRFLKPNILKNNPTLPSYFNDDPEYDEIIKSLLFHNLMKPYVPQSIDSSILTHDCLECHDMFVLESSLSLHMSRRSSLIYYWCRVCTAEHTFYNRCSLFKHLREHNSTITQIDTACIKILPLPNEIIEKGGFSTVYEDLSITHQQSITTSTNNDQNEKITTTTVSGFSKSTCTQVRNSSLLVKNIHPEISNNQSQQRPNLNYHSPKNRKLSVVPSMLNQNKGVLPNITPANRLLLSNKLSNSSCAKNIAQKSVNVMRSKSDDKGIIIVDDKCENIITNIEEKNYVTNVIKNNIKDKKSSPLFNMQPNQIFDCNSKVKNKALKRSCSECGAFCVNIAKHLNSYNRPTRPSLTCKVCQLILPSRCALQIHYRIHVKMPPFKCPECGEDFDSWNEIYPHLKLSCGHFAKCVRYLCTVCKSHFNSVSALSQHISEKHSRDIYRCPACPVAFFSKHSLTSHFISKHPQEKMIGGSYKQCKMCPPRKLIAINEFAKHVDNHARNNTNWIYGYKCPYCEAIYGSKMAFIFHQKKETEKLDSIRQKNGKTPLCITPATDLSASNVETMSDSNSDIEDEPTIIRKSPIIFDEAILSEKDPLSLEDWEDVSQQRVKEKREELCIVCKTNVVTLLPGIDLNDQSLCCKHCVKPLDPESLANGVEDSVSLKRKKTGSKGIQRFSSSDENRIVAKKRRASDVSLSNGSVESSDNWPDYASPDQNLMKTKHQKKQNYDRIEHGGQIQGQVITYKSPDDLVCSKCNFSANSKCTFLDHIKIHRSDPNDFQCQECGLCFVVLPSLERHLQVHHAIKDVGSYMQHNLACLPQKNILPVDGEDDYQCRVCHEMFNCNSTLEKHFRTHGMAFMNSLSKSP